MYKPLAVIARGSVMKYVNLAQHLHELRAARSGRIVGAAMRMPEVWQGILDSEKTPISEIRYFVADLPRPFDGFFARLGGEDGEQEIAAVYVHRALDPHWQEFVAIKEMMHCFSPGKNYTGTASDAKVLVDALCQETDRYGASVAADNSAILAAAEVMLPHYAVERSLKSGKTIDEIASSQGLHPDIAHMICRFDVLHHRKNGELS